MKSSYRDEDVTLLLKDITGLVQPQSTQERERLIQAGRHYCEMLPIEYTPSEEYHKAYVEALELYAKPTAYAVSLLADKIILERGKNVVLVSLARAGIPIGILLKHYIKNKYQIDVFHYSISIIRGRGIDKNAMNYLLLNHKPQDLLFVDGWIGKGAIRKELEKDIAEFENVSPELAVVADPAYMTALCGTHEDILIPSSCLNCTVSGLISRTFLRDDIIGPEDYHGAMYYKELKEQDVSYSFIQAIEEQFDYNAKEQQTIIREPESGANEVKALAKRYNISDINLIKPGIGETTRVLLRRVPWKVLINENFKNDIVLEPIRRLALEKQVQMEYVAMNNYKTCGIIKKLADA